MCSSTRWWRRCSMCRRPKSGHSSACSCGAITRRCHRRIGRRWSSRSRASPSTPRGRTRSSRSCPRRRTQTRARSATRRRIRSASGRAPSASHTSSSTGATRCGSPPARRATCAARCLLNGSGAARSASSRAKALAACERCRGRDAELARGAAVGSAASPRAGAAPLPLLARCLVRSAGRAAARSRRRPAALPRLARSARLSPRAARGHGPLRS